MDTPDHDHPFWEQREQVERFAAREPDLRLIALVDGLADPSRVRALDVGCAGGRNTVFLAGRGVDVYAVDSSEAMVAHTRERLAAILGDDEAAERVHLGTMDDLSRFESGSVDLVVALGIYHQAHSRGEFRRALDETARVLTPGGRALVATFDPRTDPTGAGLTPVPGQPGVFTGFRSEGSHTLLDADEVDAEAARAGLVPDTPTATVEVETHPGRRVTVNALYRRASGS